MIEHDFVYFFNSIVKQMNIFDSFKSRQMRKMKWKEQWNLEWKDCWNFLNKINCYLSSFFCKIINIDTHELKKLLLRIRKHQFASLAQANSHLNTINSINLTYPQRKWHFTMRLFISQCNGWWTLTCVNMKLGHRARYHPSSIAHPPVVHFSPHNVNDISRCACFFFLFAMWCNFLFANPQKIKIFTFSIWILAGKVTFYYYIYEFELQFKWRKKWSIRFDSVSKSRNIELAWIVWNGIRWKWKWIPNENK